ncbi:hypothetical protein [Methylobacterium sp. JK268]
MNDLDHCASGSDANESVAPRCPPEFRKYRVSAARHAIARSEKLAACAAKAISERSDSLIGQSLDKIARRQQQATDVKGFIVFH